jgi:hypothetical protein
MEPQQRSARQQPLRQKQLRQKQLEQQRQLEEVRMQEVLGLLQDLFKREEVAVKHALACLYDVATGHLLLHQVKHRRLRPVLGHFAKLSKPAFGLIAIQWFHKNCPQLVTDWLYTVVTFEEMESEETSTVTTAALSSDASAESIPTPQQNLPPDNTALPLSVQKARSALIKIEGTDQNLLLLNVQETERLRQQVRRLTGVLLVAIVCAGGLGLWVGYRMRPPQPESVAQPLRSRVPHP